MMNKEQKKNYIEEIRSFIENNDSIMITHYQGLNMTQLDKLRTEMRKHNILFKITKNRITKLALEKTKCKELSSLFTGPTAVAFSKDAISTAKVLTKFSRENKNLKILGGIMGNEILNVEQLNKIATLPSLEEARAKIATILSSPAQKIVSILLAPGSKIAILALEKSKKPN